MITNFSLNELRCHDGTAVPKQYLANAMELMENLQVIRDTIGEPLHINSGYRTPAYNKSVGGKPASKHMLAQAADLTTKNYSPRQLHRIIEKLITEKKIKQGGLGLYPGFVHYDVRGVKARW